jgi:hypothetical protein
LILCDCSQIKTRSQKQQKTVIVQTIFEFVGRTMKMYRPIILKSMNEQNLKDYSDIKISIVRERLRQARYSFNAALAASAVSAGIGFIGAGLLLLGTVSEGTVTALGGAASCAGCLCVAKDSNERLDRIAREIIDGERLAIN